MVLTAYIVLKCVQLGLSWQMETKKDIKPTMPNPITEHMDRKEVTKHQEEQINIMNEWLNGGDPK